MTTFKSAIAPALRISLLLLSLSFLHSCVLPIKVHYVKFHKESFSTRPQPAVLHQGDIDELLKGDYLLIGYMDVLQNMKGCYSNNTCTTITEGGATEAQVLAAAAKRGGDKVSVLEESLILTPDTLSVCSFYTTTTTSDKDGNPITTVTCASYEYYDGHREQWQRRVLLWRHTPVTDTVEKNSQAMQQAQQTLTEAFDKEPSADRLVTTKTASTPFTLDDTTTNDTAGGDVLTTRIVLALKNDNLNSLKPLIDSGEIHHWRSPRGRNALTFALAVGAEQSISALLATDYPWSAHDQGDLTSINMAVAKGRLDIVKQLKQQADHQFDAADLVFLEAIAYSDSPEVFAYFDQQGLSFLEPLNNTVAVHGIIQYCSPSILSALLERKEFSQYRNAALNSLHFAAAGNCPESIALLLGAGVDVNVQSPQGGDTPLHYAVSSEANQAVLYLLQAGADAGLTNENRQSPLFFAMATQQFPLLNAMLDQAPGLDNGAITVIESLNILVRFASFDDCRRFWQYSQGRFKYPKLDEYFIALLARYGDERHIQMLADDNVPLSQLYVDKTLAQHARDGENFKAFAALLTHGVELLPVSGGHVTHLEQAIYDGDEFMVVALRKSGVTD